MPQPSELFELVESLERSKVLITYHGTTLEKAQAILKDGFKRPDLFAIMMEAYQLKGLTREVRRQLPPWAIEFITWDWTPRLQDSYRHISFAPHGIASRWAGWNGEVFYEMVRQINVIQAFMATDLPKTEDVFWEWYEDIDSSKFYQKVGTPAVLKAWVQVEQTHADKILRQLRRDLAEYPLEIAWHYWNFTYRDDRTDDPSLIRKVELGDPPFTGLN